MKSTRELPTDRLATADAEGRRIYLFPADVSGNYRKLRTAAYWILIVFFLALPWLRIGGHQAVLFDIARRRFALFGLTFWAHDAPMLVFVFGGAALALAAATAAWGRVWCGWACPQTVFIDAVFRKIERVIEGDHLARRKLAEQPWTGEKLYKRALKWSLFLAASLVITHSFLAYFVGTEELARMVRRPPLESPGSFGFMAFATAVILFDFGWFREQFCTIACPYGRFQSLLMDESSQAIVYDSGRGEPRKGSLEAAGGKSGDCVNCYRCVQVCPTGVDIRRGVQLECIACTACIDACDDVMARLERPRGLIRYDSLAGLQGKRSRTARPRTILYLALLTAFLGGLLYKVNTRSLVDAAFIRAAETPYQVVDTLVINHFRANITNQTFEPKRLRLLASPLEPNAAAEGLQIVMAQPVLELADGARSKVELFVKFPKSLLMMGKARIRLAIVNEDAGTNAETAEKALFSEEVTLVGPFN